MAAPTQLSIYNGALRVLGETPLNALTDNRPARHLLDDVWDDEGVEACLEAGLWNFAMRTVQGSYDPDVTPDFGYQYVFDKPDDWVRTAALCSDEFFKSPVLEYVDENGRWYANLDTIYVRYVSDDSAYGLDYSTWTRGFRRFVHHYFANEVVPVHTQDKEKIKLVFKKTTYALKTAKARDAMADPPGFPPPGRWLTSRRGRSGGRELGRTGALIG